MLDHAKSYTDEIAKLERKDWEESVDQLNKKISNNTTDDNDFRNNEF